MDKENDVVLKQQIYKALNNWYAYFIYSNNEIGLDIKIFAVGSSVLIFIGVVYSRCHLYGFTR